jgi:hypothetical protein
MIFRMIGVCDLLSSYDRLLLHIITILIVLVSLFYFLLGLTGLFWNTEDLLGFWGSRFGCWGFGSWLCRPRRLRRLNARVTQRPSNRYSFIFSSPSPSVSLFLCDSIYIDFRLLVCLCLFTYFCNLFLMSFAMAQNYRPPKDNSVANSWFGLCAFISTCLNKVERAHSGLRSFL